MSGSDRLVPVGRVGRPHGVDGSFVVEDASDDASWFAVGATLLVDGVPAQVVSYRRVGKGRAAIRFERTVSRGATLAVPEGALPEPGEDTWYAYELVGLAVEEEGGRALGTVADVHPGIANDNLELSDGTLVPLIGDAVREVDLAGGRIVVTHGFLS